MITTATVMRPLVEARTVTPPGADGVPSLFGEDAGEDLRLAADVADARAEHGVVVVPVLGSTDHEAVDDLQLALDHVGRRDVVICRLDHDLGVEEVQVEHGERVGGL